MKAMILAAGKGTRLQPLTNDRPKALVEIQGKPLLEIILLKLKKSGFTDIIINVHHFAEQIIDFVNKNDFGINIEISDEREKLLDSGGGILKAKDFFVGEKAFLVHNVDILSDLDLFALYDAHINSPAIATLAVKERPTSRQLIFDLEGKLCQWKNVQTGEIKQAVEPFGAAIPYAFSGIYMLSTDIFKHMPNKQVFSIIDVFLQLAKENHLIRAYVHNYSKWYDMGRYEFVKDFNKNGNINLFF